MQTATLHQLKKELETLDRDSILQICLRLARSKKENKELLSYLIYDANNEDRFRQSIKTDMQAEFLEINRSNIYWIKKSLRKILRNADKVIRFSGSKETEIELRIHFLRQIKINNLPVHQSKVLVNMLQTQLKKINTAIDKVHEDLQYDYGLELDEIMGK
jgi:type III secretory pathway component EscV